MNLTLLIALRNLLRQKRRNILLGIGIGFGMMVFVVAHSFTQGLSDVILNRLIVDLFGHVMIVSREKVGNNPTSLIIRDKDEMIESITRTLDDVKEVKEAVSTALTKVVGNGASVFTVLMGVRKSDDKLLNNLDVVDGDINDFKNKDIPNPLILFSQKAKELNVKVGDTVKVRMTTIYGQVQSARLNLVAIVESKNLFMDAACLVPLNSIKNLMGYQPYETAVLLVIFNKIKNPEITLAKADKLHSALQPKPAIIYGSFKHNEHTAQGTALGFKNDKASIDVYSKCLTILKGDLKNFSTKEEKVIVGKSLADTLQVDIGDTVTLSYETRFEGPSPDSSYKVAAVVSDEKGQYSDTVFLNEPDLHKIYFEHLPQKTGKFPNAFVPGKDSEIFPAIALSYKLLDRTNSLQELEKKTREFKRKKWKGNITDVVCMQEVADMALKLEATLNIISLITILILFFIILIGVVNTLRMAVRERTREIGTVRAIGMQKNQVCLSFIMESVFLSLFASIAGIVAGFIVMHLISLMTFNPENMFSIFLDEGHVHFLYNLKTISGDLMLIVIITILTAYFPARRAANLSVAHALGHYE